METQLSMPLSLPADFGQHTRSLHLQTTSNQDNQPSFSTNLDNNTQDNCADQSNAMNMTNPMGQHQQAINVTHQLPPQNHFIKAMTTGSDHIEMPFHDFGVPVQMLDGHVDEQLVLQLHDNRAAEGLQIPYYAHAFPGLSQPNDHDTNSSQDQSLLALQRQIDPVMYQALLKAKQRQIVNSQRFTHNDLSELALHRQAMHLMDAVQARQQQAALSITHPGFPPHLLDKQVNQQQSKMLRMQSQPPRKMCRIDGCVRWVVKGGVCVSHGAQKIRKKCDVEGCPKQRVHMGMCKAHFARAQRCKVDGCSKAAKQPRGYCVQHGDSPLEPCQIRGCTKPAGDGGMCVSHSVPVTGPNGEELVPSELCQPATSSSGFPPLTLDLHQQAVLARSGYQGVLNHHENVDEYNNHAQSNATIMKV